jgi:hypothetical protein
MVSDLIPLENSTATWLAGATGRNGHVIFPASTRFRFRVTVEQADYVEQGLLLVGIYAFAQGQIVLGADRSRGYGQGRLAVDWSASRCWEADRLLEALPEALSVRLLAKDRSLAGSEVPADQPFTEEDARRRLQALDRWLSGMTRAESTDMADGRTNEQADQPIDRAYDGL